MTTKQQLYVISIFLRMLQAILLAILANNSRISSRQSQEFAETSIKIKEKAFSNFNKISEEN